MAREKFKTLTEQMYYTLIALQEELCGVDVMEAVRRMTDNRIRLGPGTLYTLLGDFQKAGLIAETQSNGGKKNYQITEDGRKLLLREHRRHLLLIEDFEKYYRK